MPADDQPIPPPNRLRELAGLFLKLGFTAFGGPAAHVALMEEEIVTRRRWIDRQHFLDLVAAVNFIPGPNSTELAIHIGQIRAGTPGLLVAGVCFISPAMLIVVVLAWAYMQSRELPHAQPIMATISACIVAVIIMAAIRFGAVAIRDRFTAGVAIVAALLALTAMWYPHLQPELLAIVLAAVGGLLRYQMKRKAPPAAALAIALPPEYWPDLARLAAVLFKIGATLFGSGYVLVSYLQADMIDRRGWMTARELTDATSVGFFTPGPLLTTATFVGYLLGSGQFGGGTAGGVIGALVATVAIFLPSFLLVWIFGPMLQRLRQNARARSALDAMNAAVVGLMVVVALRLAGPALYHAGQQRPHWLGVAVLAGSLLALWHNVNATWLILIAGALGAASMGWS